MNGKRLLFVTNELSFFFSHRLSLAKAAQQVGFEIHVATPPSNRVAELLSHGFYFHPISLGRRSFNPFREFRTMVDLFRIYRALKVDIVHHLTIKPVLYGGFAARCLRVPAVVNTMTGLGYLFISNAFLVKCLRQFCRLGFYFTFRHPNMRVIFQNREDESHFINARLLKRERAVLIRGSGVPLNEFKPLPEPQEAVSVVLLPSRLLWDKGVGEFVQAARILHQSISVRMVLAGCIDVDNPAAISQKDLDGWVAEGLVEYWGYQSPIQQAFAQCHLVCLPSYREGMPRVLIEAAACERPIVSTDVAGCRDIVSPGENGLLVASKDALALANAIEQLVMNPELRQSMGKRGRQMVEAHFSSALVNRKTLAVYENLVSVSS